VDELSVDFGGNGTDDVMYGDLPAAQSVDCAPLIVAERQKFDTMKRVVGVKLQEIADMGWKEVNCWETAFLYEHRADLLLDITKIEVRLAEENISRIRDELEAAKKILKQTLFFRRKEKKRVSELELLLADAEARVGLTSREIDAERDLYNSKSLKLRKLALETRGKRLASIAALVGSEIDARREGIRADFDRVAELNSAENAAEASEMIGRAKRDVEISQLVDVLRDREFVLDSTIRDAIDCHKRYPAHFMPAGYLPIDFSYKYQPSYIDNDLTEFFQQQGSLIFDVFGYASELTARIDFCLRQRD
jgi:hypothetical protein